MGPTLPGGVRIGRVYAGQTNPQAEKAGDKWALLLYSILCLHSSLVFFLKKKLIFRIPIYASHFMLFVPPLDIYMQYIDLIITLCGNGYAQTIFKEQRRLHYGCTKSHRYTSDIYTHIISKVAYPTDNICKLLPPFDKLVKIN